MIHPERKDRYSFSKTNRHQPMLCDRQEEPALKNLRPLSGPALDLLNWSSGWQQEATVESAIASYLDMNDLLAPFVDGDKAESTKDEIRVNDEFDSLDSDELAPKPDAQPVAEMTIDYIDWTVGGRKSTELSNNLIVLPGLKSLMSRHSSNRKPLAPEQKADDLTAALREMMNFDCGVKPNTAGEEIPGVRRSARGTIEMVLHPTGRKITPRYNSCGMLVRVDLSDGAWFECSREEKVWRMRDESGREALDQAIVSLTFDRAGNLTFVTAGGHRTTIYTNGMVSVDRLDKAASA